MKKNKFGALALTSALTISGVSTLSIAATLKTDVQKASYGIGQQIGKGLKAQNVDVDVDVLAESIKDVLTGKPSQMTDDQIKETFTKLQEVAKKKAEEAALKAKEEGTKFLEKNKKEKGVVTTKSGLQYKVVKSGKGDSPKDDSKVKVHYEGTLIDGTVFDSSFKRNQPAEFPVGGVIPGWTEALKLMKPGAEYELVIPSDLAYGSRGTPGIPPNSVLKFKVQLLEVIKKEPAKTAEKKK